MPFDEKSVKGRGAQEYMANRFLKHSYGVVHWEGIDEVNDEDGATEYRIENAKSIVNPVNSPDLNFNWSINPYQGCEHGCSYCYARPTHEYWGYNASLDFERIVLVKRNAPELLEQKLRSKNWKPDQIMLSGMTDPYQPIERKEKITRKLLEVMVGFRHPVGLITKNALVTRDIDLLRDLASENLVHVALSITTLNEDLRRLMEPRTSTGSNRVRAIEALSKAGIPVFVMVAPIIPSINDMEVPAILKTVADAGARGVSYTVVRTNGAVKTVFENWLRAHFPERANKVLAQMAHMHGGSVEDTRSGIRMKGDGAFAESIQRLFKIFRKRYFAGRSLPAVNTSAFRVPAQGQLDLFD